MVYAEVIGNPVAHSRSPIIHKEWLRRAGIDADFRRTHVEDSELKGWLDVRRNDPNWRGASVTMPHKETLFHLCDDVAAAAKTARAINCIVPFGDAGPKRKVMGFNTDVLALFGELPEPMDWVDSVTIFGCGGVARAAITALCLANEGGCPRIIICARDVGKAEAMLAQFDVDAQVVPFDADVTEGDIIINCTPLGELPAIRCKPRMVVDYVYGEDTSFIVPFVRQGIRAVSGIDLLLRQGTFAFGKFFGKRADVDEHIRSLVVADIHREQREREQRAA